MQYTSERIMPEFYSSDREQILFMMHIGSYRYLLEKVRGKRVLDMACGLGYGSRILSQSASSVTGADLSEESIEEAKRKYKSDNLEFIHIDPADEARLPFEDGVFDAVAAFQVFEHLSDCRFFLKELSRVLKRGGVLYLITPNRDSRMLRMQHPWNHHHIREYTFEEVYEYCRNDFKYISLYGVTLKKEYSEGERRRVRRLALSSLPFTLKLIPNSLRISMMALLWKAANRRGNGAGRAESKYSPSEVTAVRTGIKRTDFNILAECRKEG